MINNRKIISRRVLGVFLLMLFASVLIGAQLFKVQFVESDYWMKERESSTRVDTIYGKRGTIFSADGDVLATSLAYYKVAMDPTVSSELDFNKNIELLANKLASEYKTRSSWEYQKLITDARKKDDKYVLIDKKVDFNELQEMKTWPLFNLGKNAGGFISERYDDRKRPFGELGKRTIGMARENAEDIGIEGSFNRYLIGDKMPISMVKVSGARWIQANVIEEQPEDGKNVYISIDVDMQDIAHNALEKSLINNAANHGCVVIMEVETGAIKAIANLGKDKYGNYHEMFNYAVGEAMEPGSTFKAAILLSLIADKKVSLNTMVDLEGGTKMYYDRKMRDDHAPEEDIVTCQKAFETSSNVGLSKMVTEAYSGDPWELINRLKFLGLNSTTNVEIKGERSPKMPNPGESDWSGVSLPWLAIGYEVKVTPLQLLTFYNAIANNGRMMQPYLVTGIKKYDQEIESYGPKYIKSICSEREAYQLRKALRGVVLRGTAKGIASEHLTLAGKTGTAIISQPKKPKKYQASFAGFFPAEKPKYSCIVVVNDPQNGRIYGSQVAAPVFKEIAEKSFAQDIELLTERKKAKELRGERDFVLENTGKMIPETKSGIKEDIVAIYDFLETPYEIKTRSHWVNAEDYGNEVHLKRQEVLEGNKQGEVPNVIDMGLRDALYLLENKGLKVQYSGIGKVSKQSLSPGERFSRGDVIKIVLS